MSSDRIRWTQDERDAIVTCAVQYARGGVIHRLEALNLGMKAALRNQSRHRKCVSVSHFGPYINEEFDRRLHTPEKVGDPLPKIGRTEAGEVRAPAPVAVVRSPQEVEAVPTVHAAPGNEDRFPEVLADDEEIVLNFPGVVIPASIVNRIAAFVEARVMTRVMAIMQAAQGQPLSVDQGEAKAAPVEEAPLPKEPAIDGARLHVIVIGFMPQRKQWLMSAIPSRLRTRLGLEFVYENSPITPDRNHIIIHCTMKEQSEVPQRLVTPGRYYRTGHNAMAVLETLLTAADYHLLKLDQHHATAPH